MENRLSFQTEKLYNEKHFLTVSSDNDGMGYETSRKDQSEKIQWITFVCMAVVLLLAISAIIADALSLMPLTAIFNVVCGVASAAIPK